MAGHDEEAFGSAWSEMRRSSHDALDERSDCDPHRRPSAIETNGDGQRILRKKILFRPNPSPHPGRLGKIPDMSAAPGSSDAAPGPPSFIRRLHERIHDRRGTGGRA